MIACTNVGRENSKNNRKDDALHKILIKGWLIGRTGYIRCSNQSNLYVHVLVCVCRTTYSTSSTKQKNTLCVYIMFLFSSIMSRDASFLIYSVCCSYASFTAPEKLVHGLRLYPSEGQLSTPIPNIKRRDQATLTTIPPNRNHIPFLIPGLDVYTIHSSSIHSASPSPVSPSCFFRSNLPDTFPPFFPFTASPMA